LALAKVELRLRFIEGRVLFRVTSFAHHVGVFGCLVWFDSDSLHSTEELLHLLDLGVFYLFLPLLLLRVSSNQQFNCLQNIRGVSEEVDRELSFQ